MRRLLAGTIAALALAASGAPAASAEFGIEQASVEITDRNGAAWRQAGSHPFALRTELQMRRRAHGEGTVVPDGQARNLKISYPPGLTANLGAVPRCSAVDFATVENSRPNCSDASAVGESTVEISFDPIEEGGEGGVGTPALYNLVPPPGVPIRLGFNILGVPVTIDLKLNHSPPYNGAAHVDNIAQAALFYSSVTTVWGDPHSPLHDEARGHCLGPDDPVTCPLPPSERKAFLVLPRSCAGPLTTTFEALSWPPWTLQEGQPLAGPPASDTATARIEPGMVDCPKLDLEARVSAQPTSDHAASPTGLDFNLQIDDQGITNPAEDATAFSDIRKAVVTLPEGVTVNPSQAEGLAVCSEAELDRETLSSEFGEGCPAASKIGTVEVESPLIEDEVLKGSIFVAEPYENRFGTLLAIYQVIKNPKLGAIFKLAGKVEPHPRTGQLVTTFDDLPQQPFSDFRLRFREGGRSPLITPSGCGTFTTEAQFYPWANPTTSDPLTETPGFQITRGVGGASCPSSGTPPFEPGFQAGTLNNAAGAHSPFAMRLTRRDGDQDLTRFDAVLPPGVTAKLAGIPWCPDAAIARARGRDGTDELRDPSCPLASQIGAVQGGAGVGSQLTYVPGKVYLAGPVGGAPISVVGIVPAVAGPFDVGTIVVRQALDLDPITGQAKVVSAASDRLPHILAGIPLKVRDIQVSVNRPNFTLNPTNCKEMATLAGIWGGGSNVFSAHDDFPVLRQARFQVAGCAALGFEPKLAIKLKGGVKRGAHPALRAHVVPRPGDANFSRAVVTLPTSAFLDQAHIRTICTRVQFAAPPGHGAHCPPGARYGFARAWSPLLDGPVTGPVYLRSSDNNLPDLVAALTGPPSARVQVELSARIDSVKGGIRSTFAGIPDLPVSRFILDMQGGKKGLIVNSRHLCHKPARNRAKANLRGQNGRLSKTRPRVVATKCSKRRKAKRKRAKRAAGHLARASAVGRGER